MGFSHHYTFMQERVSKILLAVLQKKGTLGRLRPPLWGSMSLQIKASQGQRRCKEQISLKARHYFNQHVTCALQHLMPVPCLTSKMKAKLISFIPESCFADGTTNGLGFASLCSGLPVPTWELSVGFLVPLWSLQRRKTKVGNHPSCRMVCRKSSGHSRLVLQLAHFSNQSRAI